MQISIKLTSGASKIAYSAGDDYPGSKNAPEVGYWGA
jgi:hypothetical protein